MIFRQRVTGIKKIQWIRANLGVALVMEENMRKVNSRGEQDRRREKLDDDEISWMTKKFVGKGCRGWKMVEGVIPVVTCGLACIRAVPSVALSSTASDQYIAHHRSWHHFSRGQHFVEHLNCIFDTATPAPPKIIVA
jgi:hypothetical protein